jgi:sigma-B regulation protein RsbU (phosphoserine phosphatase)
MLKLEDFFHLPQLDPLVEQLVTNGSGLLVVAGLDPRPIPTLATGDGFLPSGRSAIFRILMREILTAHQPARAIVVTEDRSVVQIPRQLRRQVGTSLVQPPTTYADQIADAVRCQPELLAIDRLCTKSAPAALEAAQKGLRVLSQLDTVSRGAGVAGHLLDLGVPQERLSGLAWVVSVQRLATLCPRCKQPVPPTPAQLARLRRRYPELADLALRQSFEPVGGQPPKPGPEPGKEKTGTFCRATGCADCHYTGRHGDVAVFDVFRADANAPSLFGQPSLLSLEEYILRLAALGYLDLDDLLQLEADQLRRTYNLLTAREHTLADANTALGRKLAELEVANRVLQQRTEALISLHDIGQTLTTSTDLDDLAARVCRNARDLCGADRVILYFLRPSDEAEVLAVSGWDRTLIHQKLDAALLFGANTGTEPTPFVRRPPGVPSHSLYVEGLTIRAGLRVPLIAQHKRVGLMIVQTARKSRFAPGEVALLQTFANQAALAIQRAGLIEQLRAKIAQLEAAQAELVKKERMERELELARQVQQSVLPRIFPLVPGYTFAARNEPARQVGGDFYDVILLDADRFGVVIADVSDKGMPAALYMALTRSLLLAESRRERSPRTVLTNVNRLLLELGEPSMFVTVFYGVVEVAARQLTYTRAGHDRPLLLREGTVQLLSGQGAFLGFLEENDLHLSEEQITLAPGDRLVLYTDGLTDVLASDNRPFGLGRLKSLLQSHARLSPVELCATAFADLATYQGTAEQYDDMTILVVEVK